MRRIATAIVVLCLWPAGPWAQPNLQPTPSPVPEMYSCPDIKVQRFSPWHCDYSSTPGKPVRFQWDLAQIVAVGPEGQIVGYAQVVWIPRFNAYRLLIHVYGDDPTTLAVEGPISGQAIILRSNVIIGCGQLRTAAPLPPWTNWGNKFFTPVHPADFNEDGAIDEGDAAILRAAIATPDPRCRFDINGDGEIDELDEQQVQMLIDYHEVGWMTWSYGCK